MVKSKGKNPSKKIICICHGDSSDISTWSNVPYLVTQELMQNGYTLHRVNIAPPRLWQILYNRTIFKVLSLFCAGHEYDFNRTLLYTLWANRVISKNIRNHSDAAFCLFFTYSFCNKVSKIPSVLLCDWTFETLIRDRKKRAPYWFEKTYIKLQRRAIATAEYVISLFPKCADAIQTQVPTVKLLSPGKLPINNNDCEPIVSEELITLKQTKNRVLFIGRQNYIEACVKLIESISILNKCGAKNYELHIIGLTPKDLPKEINIENIYFYGFLHKDIDTERDLYYKLIRQATIFANPTPEWGGYSSMLEAMLYCTPVLVAAYPELVSEFGNNIDFGIYTEFNAQDIANSIDTVVANPNYSTIALNAHNRVKDRTWSKYVKELLLQVKLQS